MRSIIIDKNLSNKRIDKVLKQVFPNTPMSAFYKAFRKKDIKVNGIRIKEDYTVSENDKVEVYIIDSLLEAPPAKDFKINKGFSVVYEDSNLLIVDKDQGVPVHPDREQSANTLIDLVQSYLQEKGEYDSGNPNAFAPSLCHRLDRNTGGLVLIAKNGYTLKMMSDFIKDKEVRKFYQCYVKGPMPKKSEELKAFLFKDERKSRVFISDRKVPDSLEIITRYRTLDYHPDKDISRLEVELVTGRTHQIRAHLAHIGHPIIGDGKYGTNAINRPLGAKQQMLWAYKLVFDFREGGSLNYLKGQTFQVEPRFQITVK